MIFSELFGAYYNTVAAILKSAAAHPLKKGELIDIVNKKAFGESILNIDEQTLSGKRWQLIRPDGTALVKHEPTVPVTVTEKRWLKAICADPRVRLFTDELPDLTDVEPLFTAEDYLIFDKYSDGDPFEDEDYIKNFRLILDALEKRYPLNIRATTRKGGSIRFVIMPKYLEYSEKDDKFRLIGEEAHSSGTVNLGRIISCEPCSELFVNKSIGRKEATRTVELELIDNRKALERVLLHFAHFEKQAERLDENRYKISVKYEKEDETEMVIRVLSFGPMIKVTAPEHFSELIKDRLKKQMSCER